MDANLRKISSKGNKILQESRQMATRTGVSIHPNLILRQVAKVVIFLEMSLSETFQKLQRKKTLSKRCRSKISAFFVDSSNERSTYDTLLRM